jgi:hypothetical protein
MPNRSSNATARSASPGVVTTSPGSPGHTSAANPRAASPETQRGTASPHTGNIVSAAKARTKASTTVVTGPPPPSGT